MVRVVVSQLQVPQLRAKRQTYYPNVAVFVCHALFERLITVFVLYLKKKNTNTIRFVYIIAAFDFLTRAVFDGECK